ncbi:MAG: undecaprenyldiphospho-muramoylpentapeptide beta-N-acetylglucosaminyltransferase [Acutalibacteraceae bacterium]|nr:undecaprenyldiphospho-muramoylpentapeptide beta-N-acetylglucosaminyltransferase [Oscillospiraceae bacterium]
MKFLFAAGGTGGHINPALAVAGEIREKYPESEILFIGTKNKMESKLVPQAGFDFAAISISGFQRKLSLKNIAKNIRTLFYLIESSFQTKKIIKRFNPDVVVGFGGYVSGPVLRCAYKMGIPTAIHEQNAFPGVTNKALAKHVDKVMITVDSVRKYLDAKNDCILTGLPVRGEMLRADRDFSRAELKVRDDEVLILSMGGSLGAKAINEAAVELISKRADAKGYRFLHSTGRYGLWVPNKIRENGVDPDSHGNIEIREYINDMDVCMSAADIVICRAGASSLSEIEALGKASILVPSPNVAENHQYHNAMALVRNGAAIIIEEKDLTGDRLIAEVDELVRNRDKREAIGKNAKAMAKIDAKEKIAQIVVGLAKGNKA